MSPSEHFSDLERLSSGPGQLADPALRTGASFRRIGVATNQLRERREELTGEFLCGRIDQASAELRQLAADLRIDFVMQDRDIRAFGFQPHTGAALCEPGDAAGALARDPIGV